MRVNEHSQQSITDNVFLGATKHLYNWLCLLVGQSVGWLVTHLFDDPHVAPVGLLGLVSLISVIVGLKCTFIEKTKGRRHD